MIIGAIDPSITCTGISILRLDDFEKRSFELIDVVSIKPKQYKNDRFKKKAEAYSLYEWYLKDKVKSIDMFVFENYSYASVGHLADLGELNGLFKHFLYLNGKPFDVIAPASVKRLVAGSGKASKEDVRDSLSNFIKAEDLKRYKNLDETDSTAVGIAYVLLKQEELNK